MSLPKYKCLRCDHEWVPRKEGKPIKCPKCQSPYWDKPRQADRFLRMAETLKDPKAKEEYLKVSEPDLSLLK